MCLIEVRVSGRFDTSGSMIPRLVPEKCITWVKSASHHYCHLMLFVTDGREVVVVVVGIGDSRSWIIDLSDNFIQERLTNYPLGGYPSTLM